MRDSHRVAGTAGLGALTVRLTAAHRPARVIFTGRNASSAKELISSLPGTDVRFVPCDLADLTSVQKAGRSIAKDNTRLDVVFCNAGVMAIPKAQSADGYEIQFATNHLGHALLIKLLMPLLEKTAASGKAGRGDVRVIYNTSTGFHLAPGIEFDTLRSEQDMGALGTFKRYGQSKLANILYAAESARRHPTVKSTAIHPGVINTGLVSNLGYFNWAFTMAMTYREQVTVDEGVKNQLWAAYAKSESVENGGYYEPIGKVGKPSKVSESKELAAQLWDYTEEALAGYTL